MKALVTTQNEQGIGLHNALLSLGHQSFLWDQNAKAAFDAFAEVKPDVLITDKKLYTRALVRCVEKFSPKLVITEDIPISADTVMYKPGQADPALVSNVAVVGQQDEKMILPLCYPVGKVDIRIYGAYKWREVVQYVGGIGVETFNNLCMSVDRVLCFGDSPQLAMNVLAAGGLIAIPSRHNKHFEGYPNQQSVMSVDTPEEINSEVLAFVRKKNEPLSTKWIEDHSYRAIAKELLGA